MRVAMVAPDGSDVEVQRNHGKPTKAAEIAAALKQKRGVAKAKPAPRPTGATGNTEPTETHQVSVSSVVAPKSAAPSTPAARPAKRTDAEPATQVARAAESPAEAATPTTPPATPASQSSPTPPVAPRKAMQVRFTGMKPTHVVEAALFSAGKPLAVEEIAETTGLPPDTVKKAVKELQDIYSKQDTVLEVGKAGAKWAMQVRAQAAEPASKFAPMEIPAKTLKTLALIAYHQPMKQADLVHMMGSKVYDHIPELVARGLIKAKEDGSTKILITTAAFPEYFGLDASNPEEIRRVMGKLVGIEAPPKEKVSKAKPDSTQSAIPENSDQPLPST